MLTQAIGIHSSPAKVNLTSQRAQIEIDNSPAQLAIESSRAQISIQSTPPQLQIDSTVPRQEMGYYDPLALLADMSRYSYSQARQAVAARNAEGAALQGIENGAGAIARLARQSMYQRANSRQFIVTMIPRTPPAIRFTPGQVNLQAAAPSVRVQITPQPPMITVRPQQLQIDVTPASLELYVRDPRSLDLTV
jgi:hypothetical protein